MLAAWRYKGREMYREYFFVLATPAAPDFSTDSVACGAGSKASIHAELKAVA